MTSTKGRIGFRSVANLYRIVVKGCVQTVAVLLLQKQLRFVVRDFLIGSGGGLDSSIEIGASDATEDRVGRALCPGIVNPLVMRSRMRFVAIAMMRVPPTELISPKRRAWVGQILAQ
jgi:hypothetical protein